MRKEAKYIRTPDGIFVFPNSWTHWDFACKLLQPEWPDPRKRIVSAGFVGLDAECIPTCFGASESLKIESRGEDDTDLFLQQIEGDHTPIPT